MENTFSEIKLFQVKPNKLSEFEALIKKCPKTKQSKRA
jgi:hypothetical protein